MDGKVFKEARALCSANDEITRRRPLKAASVLSNAWKRTPRGKKTAALAADIVGALLRIARLCRGVQLQQVRIKLRVTLLEAQQLGLVQEATLRELGLLMLVAAPLHRPGDTEERIMAVLLAEARERLARGGNSPAGLVEFLGAADLCRLLLTREDVELWFQNIQGDPAELWKQISARERIVLRRALKGVSGQLPIKKYAQQLAEIASADQGIRFSSG